jgi:hypothetical protein
MPSKETLERVAHDNWNAMGGSEVDEEILEDLGYSSPRTLERDIAGASELKRALGSIAMPEGERKKSVFCADCLRDIPFGSSCAHLSVGKRGKRTTIG